MASKNAGAQALLNFVPLARVIGRIPAGFRDEFIKTVAKYGQSSLEFGTANALGRFIKNFIYQKEIDPKQSLTEGVWDDTKAGLLVGPFMLGSAAAGRGAGRVAREQLGQAASPELLANLNQTERLAAEAQPTIAPEQDVLGRPADDVAPAPDAVFPEPVEAGALPPMGDPKRPPKPPSLFDFLISKGGIKPDGDLIALGREKNFAVMSGADTRLTEVFAMGAAGGTGGLVNIVPELMVDIYRCSAAGRPADAAVSAARMIELGRVIDQLAFPPNVGAGLAARGFAPGASKSILSPASRALAGRLSCAPCFSNGASRWAQSRL